jgi:hypothetical protein
VIAGKACSICQQSLWQNPERGFDGTGFQPVHAQAEAFDSIGKKLNLS